MIPDERQRTLMLFIHEANRGGHYPVKREILEWLDRPGFRPGKRGKLIQPAKAGVAPVPGTMSSAWAANALAATNFQTPEMLRTMETVRKQMADTWANSGLLSSFAGLQRATVDFYGTPGTPGTPAVYGPDGAPEDSVKQLRRFRWIERVGNGKGLKLTSLGRALLKAALLDVGVSDTDVLVLAAQDDLAWGSFSVISVSSPTA